jgi:predicted NBD/HSP70 family sugar kinase
VVCRCGNTGCLEAIASAAAVAASLREQGVAANSSADVVELVRSGNVVATRAVRQAGREIGQVLAACVSLLNPSVIVIGGSLAQAGDSLLAGVREVVYGRSLPLATMELQVVVSRAGERAGVIGAATMVIQHVLSPDQVDAQLESTPQSA